MEANLGYMKKFLLKRKNKNKHRLFVASRFMVTSQAAKLSVFIAQITPRLVGLMKRQRGSHNVLEGITQDPSASALGGLWGIWSLLVPPREKHK